MTCLVTWESERKWEDPWDSTEGGREIEREVLIELERKDRWKIKEREMRRKVRRVYEGMGYVVRKVGRCQVRLVQNYCGLSIRDPVLSFIQHAVLYRTTVLLYGAIKTSACCTVSTISTYIQIWRI